MELGYISLHRKMRKHWLFEEKRQFTKFEAWIDILFEVNHQDNKFLLGNEVVEVKRGSKITSLRKLADKWQWSLTKVNKFLILLEEDKMIELKKDTKKTLLTVVNYDFYQSDEWKKRHEKDTKVTQEKHEKDTKVTRKKTNNNVNNVNNANNDNNVKNEILNTISAYAEREIHTRHFHLVLYSDDYEKLCTTYSKQVVEDMIEKILSYSKDYLKKYSSFYRILNNWIKDKKTESNVIKNNDSNDSKVYKELGVGYELIKLTEEEIKLLKMKLGREKTTSYIDRINEYMKQKNIIYDNQYKTILEWWVKDCGR